MATYYCDTNGVDSALRDGSIGNEWKLLSYAVTRVTTSGDIIHINSGTYTDGAKADLSVGVSIEGAGKALVTINCSVGHSTYGSYITGYSATSTNGAHTISGFTLDGGNTSGLWGIRTRGRSNVIVHDVNFNHFNGRTGIRIEGDPATTETAEPSYYATGVQVYNCNFHDACYGTASPVAHYGALELESLSGALIHDNVIGSINGVGIKHGQYGWFKDCQLYNNTIDTVQTDGNAFTMEMYNFIDDSLIYDNTLNGPFSLNGGIRTLISGSTWNLQITDNVMNMSSAETAESFLELSHNYLLFDSNYIVGNSDHCRGLGVWDTNGLTSQTYGGPFHIQISRNVVYNTTETSIYIDAANSAVSYVDVWNNIIDTVNLVSWGGNGFKVFNGNAVTNWTFKNNIVINCDSYWMAIDDEACTGGVIDYNYVYGNGYSNGYYVKTNTIAHTTVANPALNYSGIRPDPYYRVSSGSSNVVDAGIDVGLSYGGSAPDIGAYEYTIDLEPVTSDGSKMTDSTSIQWSGEVGYISKFARLFC